MHGFLFAFLLYQAVKSFGSGNQSSSCIWHCKILKRGDQVWAINLQGRLCGSPGGLLGEVEMRVMSSRWQCEHMARPVLLLLLLSLQSCPTLCDPIDGSPPGYSVPGILQARTLEWVAIPSPMHESEKWKWSRSVVSDFAISWTVAYQAPPSMGFFRQEYRSGLPCPSPDKASRGTNKLTNPKKVFASDNL